MDKDYLHGIAKPRIEAELNAKKQAAQEIVAEDLLETLRKEVADARR